MNHQIPFPEFIYLLYIVLNMYSFIHTIKIHKPLLSMLHSWLISTKESVFLEELRRFG